MTDSPSKDEKKARGQAINRDLIRDLADLLDETRLSEIEIEQNGMRVRVARLATSTQVHTVAQSASPRPTPLSDPAGVPDADASPGDPADWAAHPGVVTSPMVGTAYVAPEPGAAAFVKVGDEVSEGQTLMIVEAMKTMNPIPAPKGGRVTKILVSDAQPVEFGEPLMILE